MRLKLKYRAVFLSDLHLGSTGCRGGDIVAFLKHVECESLYLVGDVIDMWRLRKRWYWPAEHNKVISRVLKMANRGTRVIFIPGNHDEYARQYIGLTFGGVKIARSAVHRTADGRRLYVTHGDQFDLVVKHARLLSLLGSKAYETLLSLNSRFNWLRSKLGLGYWSLSQFLKLKVKSACTYISKFEEALMDEARRKGYDGVVCGHIHKAEIRPGVRTYSSSPQSPASIHYYNCGDWVESCTALVELDDGTIRIVDGVALVEQLREQKRQVEAAPSPTGDQQGATINGGRKTEREASAALAAVT